MDTIGKQDLWSFEDAGQQATLVESIAVRGSNGHPVSDYLELAAKVAELQFRNRDYVLLFRGQKRDYKDDKNRTTLYPSIFRPSHKGNYQSALPKKFEKLKATEDLLVEKFLRKQIIGDDEISRYRIVRWSIIQHYEIFETPLLDVTHSLRIGASFASLGNDTDEAFLFVLGVPNMSGAITASAEAGLQMVRLSSVCPPSAMRPHVQEGYLLGNYPDIDSFDQKRHYGLSETDFGKRLVAKFRFDPKRFWTKSGQFQQIGPKALYPSSKEDPLDNLSKSIRNSE